MKNNFYYCAGAMGLYGERFWHKLYPHNFPQFPFVTKTLTLEKRFGKPFLFFPCGKKSFWNAQSLPNPGISTWTIERNKLRDHRTIISISGTNEELSMMTEFIEENLQDLLGIEYNISCPNIKNHEENIIIPKTVYYDKYLKLNCNSDIYKIFKDNDPKQFKRISINSVPVSFGAISGRMAQEENWKFIKQLLDEGFNVAGSSWVTKEDLNYLIGLGIKEFQIGTVLLSNPKLVRRLEDIF